MNRGLIIRAFREVWPTTLVLALVLLGVEFALSSVLPRFGAQVSEQWLSMPLARGILRAMIGADIADRIGPRMFQAMAWVHPVVLAVTWAHAVICCTRVPAGEVDRGTIDVLLGLPVSRRQVFLSESFVWLAAGGMLLGMGLAGNALGGLTLPQEQRPMPARVAVVIANLYALYAAVGGLAWLASALSDRRGRAISAVCVVLAAVFMLNYLAPFWAPLERFAFLSPLHYHRPIEVLENGAWPWKDIGVLVGAGSVLWLAGGIIFARRDLCTV